MAKRRRSTAEESPGDRQPFGCWWPMPRRRSGIAWRRRQLFSQLQSTTQRPFDSSAITTIYTWSEYNATLLKRLFTSEELAQEYSYWGIAAFGGPSSLAEDIQDFRKDVHYQGVGGGSGLLPSRQR